MLYVTFGDRLYRVREGKFFEDASVLAAPTESASKISRASAFVFFIAISAFTLLTAYGSAGRAYGGRIAYWLEAHRGAFPFMGNTQEASLVELLPLSGETLSQTETPNAPPDSSAPLPQDAAALRAANNVAVQKPYLGIPKLHIQAPIVETQLDVKSINKNLEKGIIRWPGSNALDAGGVTILLGHSSAPRSYRGSYGKVFSLLDKLNDGDSITVTTNQGTLQYRVRDHIIIDPKKTGEEMLQLTDARETLILVSCWPVGTNWQRIAVRASRF